MVRWIRWRYCRTRKQQILSPASYDKKRAPPRVSPQSACGTHTNQASIPRVCSWCRNCLRCCCNVWRYFRRPKLLKKMNTINSNIARILQKPRSIRTDHDAWNEISSRERRRCQKDTTEVFRLPSLDKYNGFDLNSNRICQRPVLHTHQCCVWHV